MTRTPMPSPLHTNHERLFLPDRGLAADASPTSEALSALQIFLNEKLGADDQRQAETLLNALLEAQPDDPDDDADQAQDKRRRMAGDRTRRLGSVTGTRPSRRR
jgi:hypothetical protein